MSEILPTESLSTSSESTSNIQTGSRWWIVLLVGVLGLAGGGLIWGIVRRGEAQTPPEVQATAVATETVQLSPIRVSSEFVGALEAQERVMLRPEVEGRIIQIQAEEGDRVLAGTPLLQLSPDRSQAVVRGAEADVDVG